MKVICALVLAAGLYVPASSAQQTGGAIAAPGICQDAITIFQDVSGFGRKDKAAVNITKRHKEMAKQGWRFVGMDVYTENGDLEGFYLSYVRDRACHEKPAD